MAGLLSSRVFDRLSIVTAKLKVSDNAIKAGALNEIKTQKRDLSGRIKRFQFERFQQLIERERNQLHNKLAMVKASDPETSLKRGFSLV
jgi:exonuclease VII large subunit